MSDYVDIYFLYRVEFTSKFISNLINHCLNIGCTTNEKGNTTLCNYSNEETDWNFKLASITKVIEDISKNKIGIIQLWYKNIDFMIQVNVKDKRIDPLIQQLVIDFDAVYFQDLDNLEDNVSSPYFFKTNIDKIIDLSKEIYLFTNPVFVGGEAENPNEFTPMPTKDELERSIIKNLLWFNIFPPKLVEKIGREKLLSAPVWKFEDLVNGGVMLVITQHPFYSFTLYQDEHREKKEEVEKHLGLR